MKVGDYVRIRPNAICPPALSGMLDTIKKVRISAHEEYNKYYIASHSSVFFWEDELDLLTPSEILAAKLEGIL